MLFATLRNLGIRLAVALVMTSQIHAARCEDRAIMIDNFTFEPAQLVVKAGTTVTWKNRDDIPHTVVSAGKFRSNTLDTDDTFAFTLATAGDYTYFCSLHPHMQGTIKVE